MEYDFETILDRRGCGSAKWEAMRALKPDAVSVPLSVADMEFPTAPEIVAGLQEYVQNYVLGYTQPTDAYFDAVVGWQKRRHNLTVRREWLETSPGVVPALGYMIDAFSRPGDGVIIMPPVYYPFSFATILNGRRLVRNPLIHTGDTYRIDFDDLERKAAEPRNTLLIFCNPHNPVGRVWTRDELTRVMDICLQNGVFVIDDEIHNDLILPGVTHTPIPALSQEAARGCAYCTAPSKTFNLAGMQASNIFLADEEKRRLLALKKYSLLSFSLNALGYESCRLAYTRAEPWLDALLPVLAGNAEYLARFFRENIPEVRPQRLEGTYLFWADFRGLGLTHLELRDMLVEDAELFLDEGYLFGPEGREFERFNIACPRGTLERACERLLTAVRRRRAAWQTGGKPAHFTPEPGVPMPDFTYTAANGAQREFRRQTAGKPTALIFHRYSSCGVTRKFLAELAGEADAVRAAGARIMVVLQSTPEAVVRQYGDGLPIEIVCDPQRRLYDFFNVFPAATKLELLASCDVPAMMRDGFDVMAAGPAEGEQLQLPAVIAVRGDGRVGYVRYGQDILDVPSAAELVRILAAEAKP